MKVRVAVSVFVTVVAAGCSNVAEVSALPFQVQTAEPYTWQGEMAAGSTLEIKGINGTVDAVPASGTTARMQAVRRARRGNPEEVQIAIVEHAGGVTICAVPPSSGSRPNECLPGDQGRLSSRVSQVSVAFTVEVPAGVTFVAQNTNGAITATDLSGPVEAYSTNGDVEVDGGSRVSAATTNGSIRVRSAGEAEARTTNGQITADLRQLAANGEPLRFVTTNGSVTLRLPQDADASIEARTTNGGIEFDLPITVERSSRRALSGRLGDGGREIEMTTTNGQIRIERGS